MSNSLAAVHPELIAEWSDRNLPLTPDNVTFGSNNKVWWKGACGHEWETSIKWTIVNKVDKRRSKIHRKF
ncbi:MAG: zinc-ribbon domain-containing protein, partial [Clostridiales bacterium]|nr:zinc-ribbon domain-containing protein [Clostridiales bacterium]